MEEEFSGKEETDVDWLYGLRTYFAVIVIGNLAWEILHLPLYTIWTTGSLSEQAFAVAHCTGGDLLIALSSLMISLLFAGNRHWPARSYMQVAMPTIALGIAYTGFSEWLNVAVRKSWAYSEWMPVIPIAGGIGLSPLLQWLVIPTAAFLAVRLQTRPGSHQRGAATPE
jgi:hypothetical protein